MKNYPFSWRLFSLVTFWYERHENKKDTIVFASSSRIPREPWRGCEFFEGGSADLTWPWANNFTECQQWMFLKSESSSSLSPAVWQWHAKSLRWASEVPPPPRTGLSRRNNGFKTVGFEVVLFQILSGTYRILKVVFYSLTSKTNK